MEMDLGKLFIGGISWDTNEERLREYFQTFGEVLEAVIMKDRNTGRARGFGFVVFADPAVAERVVMDKHVIDGRTVEAKKAIPRDDQNSLNRNSPSIHGSPNRNRTKKIFVGGLASTVTESDFKKYFDQFGTITDVVVMYDHNTQRPRGFGFITYDSEEAVDTVLLKTFHELNGKIVEVKRAVPKELSPGSNRAQLGGLNHNLSRISSFLNGYTQGINQSSIGSYGARMDGRFSPAQIGRSGYPPFGPSGFGMGLSLDQLMNPNFAGSSNFSSNIGCGRMSNPLLSGNSNRYGAPVGFGGGLGGSGPAISSPSRSLWGNESLNYPASSANSGAFMGSGNGNSGMGAFGNMGTIWGSSPPKCQGGESASAYGNGNISFGAEDVSLGSVRGAYGRNNGTNMSQASLFGASRDSMSGTIGDLFGAGSLCKDNTWHSLTSELEASNPFDYGLRAADLDINSKDSTGFFDGYSVTNRQANRGIAA